MYHIPSDCPTEYNARSMKYTMFLGQQSVPYCKCYALRENPNIEGAILHRSGYLVSNHSSVTR